MLVLGGEGQTTNRVLLYYCQGVDTPPPPTVVNPLNLLFYILCKAILTLSFDYLPFLLFLGPILNLYSEINKFPNSNVDCRPS